MAFCTECGKELTHGTKFCESCGAPVDQNAAPVQQPEPAVTQTPATPPPPPQKKGIMVLPVLGIIILILVLAAGAWYLGLLTPQKSGTVTPAVPSPTSVAIVQEPTLVPVPATTTVLPTSPSVRKLEGRYEEYYDEIYTLDQSFSNGQKETFTYDVTTPPLYIKYDITPRQITREKVINIGTSSEQTIQVSYPSPTAWFEVKVLYADNGGVVEKKGYGGDYPDVPKSEFMVRSAGNYRIEFSGSDVTAKISVLQGKS